MPEVVVIGGNIEEGLRLFKRRVSRDGTLAALKARDIFDHKASVMRKAKDRKAERRRKKMVARNGNGRE